MPDTVVPKVSISIFIFHFVISHKTLQENSLGFLVLFFRNTVMQIKIEMFQRCKFYVKLMFYCHLFSFQIIPFIS